jgi:hypothetical protein
MQGEPARGGGRANAPDKLPQGGAQASDKHLTLEKISRIVR